MEVRSRRAQRSGATREALLAAAERLIAERGLHAVGTRQISEAAGQANTAAVGYHFGGRVDLIRAMVHLHVDRIDQIRGRLVADAGDSADIEDWAECLVRPVTEHLDSLGTPAWAARLLAQVLADPAMDVILTEETLMIGPSPLLLHRGFVRSMPDLEPAVRAERLAMTRHLVIRMAVERETALAAGLPTFHPTWADTANSLIGVVTAIWNAPAPRPGTADDDADGMPVSN